MQLTMLPGWCDAEHGARNLTADMQMHSHRRPPSTKHARQRMANLGESRAALKVPGDLEPCGINPGAEHYGRPASVEGAHGCRQQRLRRCRGHQNGQAVGKLGAAEWFRQLREFGNAYAAGGGQLSLRKPLSMVAGPRFQPV